MGLVVVVLRLEVPALGGREARGEEGQQDGGGLHGEASLKEGQARDLGQEVPRGDGEGQEHVEAEPGRLVLHHTVGREEEEGPHRGHDRHEGTSEGEGEDDAAKAQVEEDGIGLAKPRHVLVPRVLVVAHRGLGPEGEGPEGIEDARRGSGRTTSREDRPRRRRRGRRAADTRRARSRRA